MSVDLMEEAEGALPAPPGEKELPAKPDAPPIGGAIPGLFQGRRTGGKLDESLGAGEWILVGLSYLLLILTFPISIWLCLQVVNEFEQAVILRLGHIWKGGTVSPGVYFILPCIDVLIRVDMRTRLLNLPLQEVLTKDPLSLDVDGAIYYRIQNPTLAVRNIADPDSATLLLTQTTLGNILGTKYLSQIICNRENIAQNIQSIVDNAISAWGIKVEQIEIKNVKTRVKVGALEGRTDTPRKVKEASITITECPTAVKFHCVQTETTGSVIHQSSTRYTLRPSRDEALTEGADFGEGPYLTEG